MTATKEVNINKKTNENINKGGKNINSPQTVGRENITISINNNQGCDINIYTDFPTKEVISSPNAVIIRNERKYQGEKKKRVIKQNLEKSKNQPEKKHEMSQQEFEELLIKVKFITFGIMGNIKWDKIKPLKFRKNKENKETALLMFEVEKRGCFIEFIVSEEDKQKFLKTNTSEIVEKFIRISWLTRKA